MSENAAEDDTAATLRKEIEKRVTAEIKTGNLSITDALAALAEGKGSIVKVDNKPPPVPQITEAQKLALARISNLYGSVKPDTVRLLTDDELVALVNERDTIDEIIGFLGKRKDESIREALANHFDERWRAIVKQAEEEGTFVAEVGTDKKGHFTVKQEESAPGTGRKAERIVSGGKPILTIDGVEKALADGKIDRKTYLSITQKPDIPRVLDAPGLEKAVKKDPNLLFALAEFTTPTNVTTSITVKAD